MLISARPRQIQVEGYRLGPPPSSIFCTVYKFFASQSQHKYKIIFFFSGEANDEANFSFFILLLKRAKPAISPYIHPSGPSLCPFLRSFMIAPTAHLLPLIAPTAHFITLGANATTCQRQAIHILASIPLHIPLPIPQPIPPQRRQTNTPKAY
jgi:hypothetical protein